MDGHQDEDDRRGPPAVDRGPTRPLTSRAEEMRDRVAATDRRARFDRRVAEVERAATKRSRRRRLGAWAVALSVLVTGPLVGALTAPYVGGTATSGVIVGAGFAVASVALRLWLVRYAATRGATAWDWQRGRHVVHGDPSRSVQSLDRSADGPGSRYTR